MNRFLIVTMAAAITASGFTVLPSHAAETAPARRAAFAEKAKEKLNLTDEQLRQIKSEVVVQKESLADIMKRMKSAKAILRDAIQKSDATETEIRAAAAKVAIVEADAAVLRAKLYGKINPILTSDQQATLKELNSSADELITQMISRIGGKVGRE